jgi:HSP20 family protein
MSLKSLVPWSFRDRGNVARRYSDDNPIASMHREVSRMFDGFFRGIGEPLLGSGQLGWPHVDVRETDSQFKVCAELPGLDEKDVEILVNDDVLTIRGEKKADIDDKERHFSERYYGRFERSLALPFEVDESKAEASFKNGVLTVTIPKSTTAKDTAKRIAINAGSDTKH